MALKKMTEATTVSQILDTDKLLFNRNGEIMQILKSNVDTGFNCKIITITSSSAQAASVEAASLTTENNETETISETTAETVETTAESQNDVQTLAAGDSSRVAAAVTYSVSMLTTLPDGTGLYSPSFDHVCRAILGGNVLLEYESGLYAVPTNVMFYGVDGYILPTSANLEAGKVTDVDVTFYNANGTCAFAMSNDGTVYMELPSGVG